MGMMTILHGDGGVITRRPEGVEPLGQSLNQHSVEQYIKYLEKIIIIK